MKSGNDTKFILQKLEQVEDLQEYYEFVQEHKDKYKEWSSWSTYWQEKLKKKQVTRETAIQMLIEKCGKKNQRRYDVYKRVSRWLDHVPENRDYAILMGIAFGLDQFEINKLITRYGKFQCLYVKDVKDAIWIYIIEKKKDEDMIYQEYLDMYSKFNEIYRETIIEGTSGNNTSYLLDRIYKIDNIPEFMNFLQIHIQDFIDRCKKVIKFIEDWVSGSTVHMELNTGDPGRKDRLYRYFIRLKEQETILQRKPLIELALALRMPIEIINKLLYIGGFEDLCAKDVFEGLIIFQLWDIYLKEPSFFKNKDCMSISNIKSETYFAKHIDQDNYDFLIDGYESIIDYIVRVKDEYDLDSFII